MDPKRISKILDGVSIDLEVYAHDVGMVRLIADRVRRLAKELEGSGYLTPGRGTDIIDLRD